MHTLLIYGLIVFSFVAGLSIGVYSYLPLEYYENLIEDSIVKCQSINSTPIKMSQEYVICKNGIILSIGEGN